MLIAAVCAKHHGPEMMDVDSERHRHDGLCMWHTADHLHSAGAI